MRVVFTSCMRIEAFQSQPVWQEIASIEPDVLVLLGDQIYLDYWPYKLRPQNLLDEDFQRLMDTKYSMQWNEPHFKSLFHRMLERDSVFAVWDDHDFAWDNAVGSEVSASKKAISLKLFHKWIPTSTNKPEIYHYVDRDLVRFIFLDQRSYAEPVGPESDLLGDEQYDFLNEALNHSLPYTIICGAMTLTKQATFLGIPLSTKSGQRWSNYPRDYRRFNELISIKKGCIYLGGDIHKNSFGVPKTGIRPCYELISSGVAIDKVAGYGIYDKLHNWSILNISEQELELTQITSSNILRTTRTITINSKTWNVDKKKNYSLSKPKF